MSGLSTDVVNWGAVADLEMMSTIFCAANYTRWFAAIQIYANAANRLVTDPNNTLEGLIEAAATGVTFRLYREAALTAGTIPGTYQVCRMPGVSNKGSAEEFVAAGDFLVGHCPTWQWAHVSNPKACKDYLPKVIV